MADILDLAQEISEAEDKATLLKRFCEKHNIHEVWADFNKFTAERNMKGRIYFTVDNFADGKAVECLLDRIFAPDAYSDDESLVLSTDFVSTPIAPDNPHPGYRNTNKIKSRCYLIYSSERGVIIG